MGTTLIAFGLSLSHAFGLRGSLATICSVKYDAKYEGTDTPFCACGGDEEETAEHLILYCKGLHQAAEGNGPEFFKALEFMDIQGEKRLQAGRNNRYEANRLAAKIKAGVKFTHSLYGIGTSVRVTSTCREPLPNQNGRAPSVGPQASDVVGMVVPSCNIWSLVYNFSKGECDSTLTGSIKTKCFERNSGIFC